MPAKSKSQQRFMGMVHALQKGELSPSDVSGKVKDVANRMDDKDAEDYASTKHKGKPEHVPKEVVRKLRETIRQIVKENPAAAAAAFQVIQQAKVKNSDTGRLNKVTTAYGDKSHPQHKKAKGIFQKLKDKFAQKKKEKSEKERKADVDDALKRMGITPKSESLPNKVKDKHKKMKDEPGSEIEKSFSGHHAGSLGAGDMGKMAEPDTYDWDDSGTNHNKPGHQTKKNKKKRGYEPVEETSERDYKAEYKKFQSSTKAKKYRAELNKYNRQKGTYGNGDGKDASHKGGKIVGFESQSKNRGRAEKSRLKKEELGKRCTVKEVSKWLKTLEEFRYRKVRGVDARRVASFVNNGMNEEELPISLQKKWEHKKYGREKHLANKYVETVLNISLKESVNETVIKENLISFYKYMGDFYGKKGIYPDKKGRDLKVGDINKALAVYLKKYAGDKFTGDSLDRERVRDILIKMRKLDPDYSKKESVKEKVNEAVEPRGNIKKVLDVAKNKQAKKIGGTLVDLTTAGMMTQVWDKVNDSSKEKMNRMNTKQLINLILKLWKKVV